MSDIVQGSDAWKQMRLGKATGSQIHRARAKDKKTGKWLSGRAVYKAELVLERLTKRPTEIFTTQAMKDGTVREPSARDKYSFEFNATVVQVPFIDHPLIKMSGSSPDGLVNDDGAIEIKCQQAAKHKDVLLGAPIDSAHIQQMQWLLACTGREWCDYINFNPDFPTNMQFICRRVQRDDDLIALMENEIQDFLDEVAHDFDDLIQKYGHPEEIAA